MKGKSSRRETTYILFILPALILFVVFFFYPVMSTLFLAFTDKETSVPEFSLIGFKNFKTLFTDMPIFYTAMKNNVFFTIVVTLLQSLLAFILALALDAKLKGKNFFRTYFFFLWSSVLLPSA